MREGLDQWVFVDGAYFIGIVSIAVLVVWSVLRMRRSEIRREKARRK